MKAHIIKDPKYDYLRVEPIPTQEEVEAFYAKEFYDSNAKYFNNSSLLLQKEQSDFFDARWESIYQTASEFFGPEFPKTSVFDIGFGFAQALKYFKSKGLKVSGLEPSPEGVAYAKSNGINTFHSGIENFDVVGDEKFEMVMLLNVLEHLREPEKTILNVKENLLTKNGLFVIEVPNDFNDFQEVANKEYDLDEWWVLPPNHINYFSHDSLQKLLRGCGFRIVEATSLFPLDIFLLFGDQYVGNPLIGRECHNKRVNFERLMDKHGKSDKLKELYKALARLNLGRSVVIYATPE